VVIEKSASVNSRTSRLEHGDPGMRGPLEHLRVGGPNRRRHQNSRSGPQLRRKAFHKCYPPRARGNMAPVPAHDEGIESSLHPGRHTRWRPEML